MGANILCAKALIRHHNLLTQIILGGATLSIVHISLSYQFTGFPSSRPYT